MATSVCVAADSQSVDFGSPSRFRFSCLARVGAPDPARRTFRRPMQRFLIKIPVEDTSNVPMRVIVTGRRRPDSRQGGGGIHPRGHALPPRDPVQYAGTVRRSPGQDSTVPEGSR
jgi:hypothetical protein